jgi:hypothetical protein
MRLYTKGIEKIHKKGFGKSRESGTLRIKGPDGETVFAPRPPGGSFSSGGSA